MAPLHCLLATVCCQKRQKTMPRQFDCFSVLEKKTILKKYNKYVLLSNEIWKRVSSSFKDMDVHLVIFQATENLVLDNIDLMEEFYGKSIGLLASSFSLKNTVDVPSSYLKETNDLTDALKKETEIALSEFFNKIKGDTAMSA